MTSRVVQQNIASTENLFENLSGVHKLTPSDFIRIADGTITIKQKPPGDQNVGLIMFYSHRCGHCQNMKKTIEDLGRLIGNTAFIGTVNCTNSSSKLYQELSKAADVEFFPTFKFLKNNKLYPYDDSGKREPIDFIKGLCKHTSKYCDLIQ